MTDRPVFGIKITAWSLAKFTILIILPLDSPSGMSKLIVSSFFFSSSRTAQGQFATILFFPGGGVSHKMAAQSWSSKVASSRLVSSPDSTKIQQQGAASYKNVWK